MAWRKNSISQGELEALKEAAQRAWAEDTCYPYWFGSRRNGGGQCYVTSYWLSQRLGGHVGHRDGHYAWMSSDGRFVIDLTNGHKGGVFYGENPGYQHLDWVTQERAQRFAHRANRIFENLDLLLKLADDSEIGDAFPAEEPQRSSDLDQDDLSNQYWHDEPGVEPQEGTYKFVYGNGQLEVSPSHDHQELAEHAGLRPTDGGPIATGYIIVKMGKATFEVQSNMDIQGLVRVFKDYAKQIGWIWGGIANIDGEPISDEFKPVKSKVLQWQYAHDHLWLGSSPHAELALRHLGSSHNGNGRVQGGVLRVRGQRAEVYPVHANALPSLHEWATDEGLTLYAANDNVLKTIEDLELDNLGTPTPQEKNRPFFGPGVDEREPAGVYRCPGCDQLFPNWNEYSRHRRDEEDKSDEPVEDGKFPDTDMDATFPTHYEEMQPFVMPVASIREAKRVDKFKGGHPGDDYYVAYHRGSPVGYARVVDKKLIDISAINAYTRARVLAKVVKYTEKAPKDLLPGPVPFIYDVKEDNIYVGDPGQRTSDIPGRFTPGGIVEGNYEPGGKVYLQTMTNMPYTVRHMVELFYFQHPELEVTSVHLRDDQGGDTRLASRDVGAYISALIAADPTAHAATQALRLAGGHVYGVGGAVRDAILGKEPKDIDLMVRGLPADEVRETLEKLPGRVDLTGKDFGVFRYRHKGNEVEISLPRRERSVGSGHQDFEVQADHTMLPEDDLYRRDFTANAVAVDLANGQLIDPYNGTQDIRDGVLRSVNNASLSEDPLRIVRALVANSRHGLEPDDSTREQMQANGESLHHLPPERIQQELDKLMGSKDPAAAIRLAHETGVLKHILPEVDAAMGYDQNNPHHEYELGQHLLNVLDRTARVTDDPDLRMAALLHDIGKPRSAWVDPMTGSNHYYYNASTGQGADHEELGAEMTKERLEALRYPTNRANRVTDLVRHHMFPAFTTSRGARRFMNRAGDHVDDLMTLRWADQGGKSEYPNDPSLSLDKQRNLIDQVRNEGQATDQASLAINGNDILALGIQPGPQVGQILRSLTDRVIEDPSLNTRESLLALAQSLLQ